MNNIGAFLLLRAWRSLGKSYFDRSIFAYQIFFKKIALLLIGLFLLFSNTGCSLDASLLEAASKFFKNKIQVQLLSSSPEINNLSAITMYLNFSEDVSDVSESDLILVNASITGFVGSGSVYQFTLVPSSDGVVSVRYPERLAQSVQDGSGKPTTESQLVFTVDRQAPTVLLSTVVTTPTNISAIPVSVVFSESVTGLTISDFVVTGSAAAVITSLIGSGASYELTLMPTVSGAISLVLPLSSVSDVANNGNFASNTLLLAYDPNIPLPILSSNDSLLTNLSVLTLELRFGSVSVIGLDLLDFVVTNGTVANLSGSGASYTLELIPDGDGTVSVHLPASTVTNSLGTDNLASSTLTFQVDRTPPSLSLSGPTPSTGNKDTEFVFNVTYNENSTISLTAGHIIFAGVGAAGCTAVVSGSGSTTRTVTVSDCTGEGAMTISVNAGSAQDLAGNSALAAGPSAAATLDNTGPSLLITGPTPALGNSATAFVFEVQYTGASAVALNSSHVTFTGTASTGCQVTTSGSGTSTRTVTVQNCSGDGTTGIAVAENSAQDSLGNSSSGATSSLATVDNTRPTLSIGSPAPATGNSSSTFTWSVTYVGADTISLSAADITLSGTATAGCVVAIGGVGLNKTVSVNQCSNAGNLGITIAANSAQDTAGNQALGAGPSTLATIDNTNLTVGLIATGTAPLNNLSTIPVSVQFSSEAVGFTVADLTLVNATVVNFAGADDAYTFDLIPSSDGTVSVQVLAGAATDTLSNPNTSSNLLSFTIDRVAPTLAISAPTPTSGRQATEFVFTVTYTGASAVSLSDADISLNGTATTGCAATVAGTGLTERTVTVTGCSGDGIVGISIAANSAQDAATNQALAAGTSATATVDNTAPTLSISNPAPLAGNSSTEFIYTITYTDATAISLQPSDITLTGTATAGCSVVLAGTGITERTVEVSGCTGNGNVSITVAASSAQDAVGNQTASVGPSSAFTVDNNGPTLSIATPTPLAGNSSTNFSFVVTYADAQSISLVPANVTIGGTGATGCSASVSNTGASERTVTVTGCSGNGAMNISIAANTAQDTYGNQASGAGPSTSVTVDNVGPVLTIAGPTPALGNDGTSFVWTLSYTDASVITLSAVTLLGTTTDCSAVITGSGTTTRTVTVSDCSGTGTVGFSVAANSAQDAVGNPANAETSTSATLDNTPPTLTISAPAPTLGKSTTTFEWLVTYVGADTISLNSSHVTLQGASAGCSVAVTTHNPTTRKVAVSGCTGSGDLEILVAASSASDTVGNQAAAEGPSDAVVVDNLPPILAITGPTPTSGNAAATFEWTVDISDATTLNLVGASIALTGTNLTGCAAVVSGSGLTTRTVNVSGCTAESGSVGIEVAAGVALDDLGNSSVVTSSATSATIDNSLDPNDPGVAGDLFIATFDTRNLSTGSSDADQVILPLVNDGSIYHFAVAWGDGQVSQIKDWNGSAIFHTYDVPGIYEIKMIGRYDRLAFNGSGDRLKILDVKQWGTNRWTSVSYMFESCANLKMSAVDAPDLSQVTSFVNMFSGAQVFNGAIGHWDTSNVTTMNGMFSGASAFNQPIGSWNTSKVTTMHSLFSGARIFNQPIGDWDTSDVVNMESMFSGAHLFNKPIGNWNTANVINMDNMFLDAYTFNQPIGTWDVSSVTSMVSLFQNAYLFNQPIGDWNTSLVVSMAGMFQNAYTFDQPIGGWNTSRVASMLNMFQNAYAFNQPIGSWDTFFVESMSGMFQGAYFFNKPIGDWDTSKVTNMSNMFQNAYFFNQPIGAWDTSQVTGMTGMFQNAYFFNQSINSWDTSEVTGMMNMFQSAYAFNQPIGNWDTSKVTNMTNMFQKAYKFNQDLHGWIVSSVIGSTGFDTDAYVWQKRRPVGVGTPYNDPYADPPLLGTEPVSAFITTWKTDNLSSGSSLANQIKLPLSSGYVYNFTVDWGDGSTSTITSWNAAAATHTYAAPGKYNVAIVGQVPSFIFNGLGDRLKIVDVKQWGTNQWVYMSSMFHSCANLQMSATDAPNLSTVNNFGLGMMFYGAKIFNGAIGHWDTSNIKSFSNMFNGAHSFNQPLNSWDTSQVTDMTSMFYSAYAFNQPIGGWNTSKVTQMYMMFGYAYTFNQPIAGWDTSKVTTMGGMFTGAYSFNQPINNWITSSLTTSGGMFQSAYSFNQPIGAWDMSKVTLMGTMFGSAYSFNQPISDWNMSEVTSLNTMFAGAYSFNQPLSGWTFSKLTSMTSMFENAFVFNRPINSWDTSKVTGSGMRNMFYGAFTFNQPIGSWDTSKVTNMALVFNNAYSFNQDLGGWNTSIVTAMTGMFSNAYSFNGSIGNWSVSSVGSMMNMFENAYSFNRDLSAWQVSGSSSPMNFSNNTYSWTLPKPSNW